MKENNIKKSILFFFILIIVAFHKFAYTGHFGFDDMNYAHIAADFLQGKIDYTNHFSFRWPIMALTALSYQLFGINDFASALPSILISILTLCTAFIIVKRQSYAFIIYTLSLISLDYWLLFYSDKLMSDIYITLSVTLSIYALHAHKFSINKAKDWQYALLLALSFFFGVISKESIVLVIPLFLYLFAVDYLLKRDKKFWLFSLGFSFLILFIYFSLFAIYTGDPFFRFKVIFQNAYLSTCSYNKEAFSLVFKRIALDFFDMFINKGMALGMVLTLASVNRKKIPDLLRFADEKSFFIVCTFLLFLSSNFMTISPTSYNPLCIDPRHYMFILPVAAIAASFCLRDFTETKSNSIAIFVLLGGVCIISYFFGKEYFKQLYLSVFFWIALRLLLPLDLGKLKIPFVLLFVLILMIKPFYFIQFAKRINYEEQKEVVQKYFSGNTLCGNVVTDNVQQNLGEYYNGFTQTNCIRFLNFNEFAKMQKQDTVLTFLLLNDYTNYLCAKKASDLPDYAKHIDSSYTEIYKNDKLKISIYEFPKRMTPKSK